MGRRKIGSLGLINYRRHPENKNYIVFGFNTVEEAEIFERELNRTKTWFEKDTERVDDGIVYLFAITESTLDEATRANGVVKSHTRDPLFKNIFVRFALILFLLGILTLGIIGYVKNPNKVNQSGLETPADTTNLER